MRLPGCVCKMWRNWDNSCCSTRLVAPTKKPWKGKRHKSVVPFPFPGFFCRCYNINGTLQHWIISVIKHLPGPTACYQLKRGNHLMFWAHKKHGLSQWGYQEWGRQLLYYLNMHNERVWNIKHGLVRHSFAAGPAARWTLNQHLPG